MLSSLHIFYYFYFKIYRLIDYIEIGLTSLPNALQKKNVLTRSQNFVL